MCLFSIDAEMSSSIALDKQQSSRTHTGGLPAYEGIPATNVNSFKRLVDPPNKENFCRSAKCFSIIYFKS